MGTARRKGQRRHWAVLTTIAIDVVISLCADMANFVELLSEQGKEKWAELWLKHMGKEWEIPTKERAITCETKMEDLGEIDRLMRQKANPTRRE